MTQVTFLGFKKLSPLGQGFIVLVLMLLIALICYFAGQREVIAWAFLAAPLYLYSVINPFLGAITPIRLKYVGVSFLVYIPLIVILYLLGKFVVITPLKDLYEVKLMVLMTFFLLCMAYMLAFVFKGVVRFLESIDE
jgi:hypothetical protein